MTTVEMEILEPALQKAHEWFRGIMEELKWDNPRKSYLALRATLQTLRDRLTPEEAVHLGAQLPMLIRGFYYEGFRIERKPALKMDREMFLDRISDYFRNDPEVDSEQVVRAVFRFLSRKVSSGEIEDIKRVLPEELRELWP